MQRCSSAGCSSKRWHLFDRVFHGDFEHGRIALPRSLRLDLAAALKHVRIVVRGAHQLVILRGRRVARDAVPAAGAGWLKGAPTPALLEPRARLCTLSLALGLHRPHVRIQKLTQWKLAGSVRGRTAQAGSRAALALRVLCCSRAASPAHGGTEQVSDVAAWPCEWLQELAVCPPPRRVGARHHQSGRPLLHRPALHRQ